jgi:GrpB-like predicted nucleotidyltransferase (UPF0157 family)
MEFMMNKKEQPIEVVAYNKDWPQLFQVEAMLLKSIFQDEYDAINHIGSTSVPGLAAKPTIDISIGVKQIERVSLYHKQMEAVGYEAWGENQLSGRQFFVKGERKRLFNVHVFETSHPHRIMQLLFRDYLRVHPEVVLEYAALKQQLAKQFSHDRHQYVEHKKAFIDSIKLGLWDEYCAHDDGSILTE